MMSEYRFLSLCLLYPQPDLADQLRQAAGETTDPAWSQTMLALYEAEPLETLQIEHTRLFTNNIEGVPCPPYEAAYVDGQLLTATTAAVAAIYAEWGLQQSLETADYLAVELQFVAYLGELAAQAEDPTPVEAARRGFVADHLRPWLPRFAADLQTAAQVSFYRQLGLQLAELL